MKEVITVNIGKTVFTIEDDACRMLQRYLDDIGHHCEKSVRKETLEDVEIRIAEILSKKLAASYCVVTIEMVKEAMATIGQAESFGEYADEDPAVRRKLFGKMTRSNNDRIIGGVCGGLAEYFGIDVTLIRLLSFALIFFGGVSLWVYLVLWIIMPAKQTV